MLKHIIAGLMLAIPTITTAAEFGTVTGFETGRKYITLTGDIKPGDSRQLYMFALLNQDATHVAFHSPGGVATEGYEIGRVMSQLGLSSYVGYGQSCISACYPAFLGGKDCSRSLYLLGRPCSKQICMIAQNPRRRIILIET